MGSTTCSTSAAITAPPTNIEPPGPRPFRPGPRSPAWPRGHKPSRHRPSCALSRPEPIKLTVPLAVVGLAYALSKPVAHLARLHAIATSEFLTVHPRRWVVERFFS